MDLLVSEEVVQSVNKLIDDNDPKATVTSRITPDDAKDASAPLAPIIYRENDKSPSLHMHKQHGSRPSAASMQRKTVAVPAPDEFSVTHPTMRDMGDVDHIDFGYKVPEYIRKYDANTNSITNEYCQRFKARCFDRDVNNSDDALALSMITEHSDEIFAGTIYSAPERVRRDVFGRCLEWRAVTAVSKECPQGPRCYVMSSDSVTVLEYVMNDENAVTATVVVGGSIVNAIPTTVQSVVVVLHTATSDVTEREKHFRSLRSGRYRAIVLTSYVPPRRSFIDRRSGVPAPLRTGVGSLSWIATSCDAHLVTDSPVDVRSKREFDSRSSKANSGADISAIVTYLHDRIEPDSAPAPTSDSTLDNQKLSAAASDVVVIESGRLDVLREFARLQTEPTSFAGFRIHGLITGRELPASYSRASREQFKREARSEAGVSAESCFFLADDADDFSCVDGDPIMTYAMQIMMLHPDIDETFPSKYQHAKSADRPAHVRPSINRNIPSSWVVRDDPYLPVVNFATQHDLARSEKTGFQPVAHPYRDIALRAALSDRQIDEVIDACPHHQQSRPSDQRALSLPALYSVAFGYLGEMFVWSGEAAVRALSMVGPEMCARMGFPVVPCVRGCITLLSFAIEPFIAYMERQISPRDNKERVVVELIFASLRQIGTLTEENVTTWEALCTNRYEKNDLHGLRIPIYCGHKMHRVQITVKNLHITISDFSEKRALKFANPKDPRGLVNSYAFTRALCRRMISRIFNGVYTAEAGAARPQWLDEFGTAAHHALSHAKQDADPRFTFLGSSAPVEPVFLHLTVEAIAAFVYLPRSESGRPRISRKEAETAFVERMKRSNVASLSDQLAAIGPEMKTRTNERCATFRAMLANMTPEQRRHLSPYESHGTGNKADAWHSRSSGGRNTSGRENSFNAACRTDIPHVPHMPHLREMHRRAIQSLQTASTSANLGGYGQFDAMRRLSAINDVLDEISISAHAVFVYQSNWFRGPNRTNAPNKGAKYPGPRTFKKGLSKRYVHDQEVIALEFFEQFYRTKLPPLVFDVDSHGNRIRLPGCCPCGCVFEVREGNVAGNHPFNCKDRTYAKQQNNGVISCFSSINSRFAQYLSDSIAEVMSGPKGAAKTLLTTVESDLRTYDAEVSAGLDSLNATRESSAGGAVPSSAGPPLPRSVGDSTPDVPGSPGLKLLEDGLESVVFIPSSIESKIETTASFMAVRKSMLAFTRIGTRHRSGGTDNPYSLTLSYLAERLIFESHPIESDYTEFYDQRLYSSSDSIGDAIDKARPAVATTLETTLRHLETLARDKKVTVEQIDGKASTDPRTFDGQQQDVAFHGEIPDQMNGISPGNDEATNARRRDRVQVTLDAEKQMQDIQFMAEDSQLPPMPNTRVIGPNAHPFAESAESARMSVEAFAANQAFSITVAPFLPPRRDQTNIVISGASEEWADSARLAQIGGGDLISATIRERPNVAICANTGAGKFAFIAMSAINATDSGLAVNIISPTGSGINSNVEYASKYANHSRIVVASTAYRGPFSWVSPADAGPQEDGSVTMSSSAKIKTWAKNGEGFLLIGTSTNTRRIITLGIKFDIVIIDEAHMFSGGLEVPLTSESGSALVALSASYDGLSLYGEDAGLKMVDIRSYDVRPRVRISVPVSGLKIDGQLYMEIDKYAETLPMASRPISMFFHASVKAVESAVAHSKSLGYQAHPYHGHMTADSRRKVVNLDLDSPPPPGKHRTVHIHSTPAGERGGTIKGVVHTVDGSIDRRSALCPRTGISWVQDFKTTHGGTLQRSGRAGRIPLRDGVLHSRDVYESDPLDANGDPLPPAPLRPMIVSISIVVDLLETGRGMEDYPWQIDPFQLIVGYRIGSFFVNVNRLKTGASIPLCAIGSAGRIAIQNATLGRRQTRPPVQRVSQDSSSDSYDGESSGESSSEDSSENSVADEQARPRNALRENHARDRSALNLDATSSSEGSDSEGESESESDSDGSDFDDSGAHDARALAPDAGSTRTSNTDLASNSSLTPSKSKSRLRPRSEDLLEPESKSESSSESESESESESGSRSEAESESEFESEPSGESGSASSAPESESEYESDSESETDSSSDRRDASLSDLLVPPSHATTGEVVEIIYRDGNDIRFGCARSAPDAERAIGLLPRPDVVTDLHLCLDLLTQSEPILDVEFHEYVLVACSFVGRKSSRRKQARLELIARIRSNQLSWAALVFKRGAKNSSDSKSFYVPGSKAWFCRASSTSGFVDDAEDHCLSVLGLHQPVTVRRIVPRLGGADYKRKIRECMRKAQSRKVAEMARLEAESRKPQTKKSNIDIEYLTTELYYAIAWMSVETHIVESDELPSHEKKAILSANQIAKGGNPAVAAYVAFERAPDSRLSYAIEKGFQIAQRLLKCDSTNIGGTLLPPVRYRQISGQSDPAYTRAFATHISALAAHCLAFGYPQYALYLSVNADESQSMTSTVYGNVPYVMSEELQYVRSTWAPGDGWSSRAPRTMTYVNPTLHRVIESRTQFFIPSDTFIEIDKLVNMDLAPTTIRMPTKKVPCASVSDMSFDGKASEGLLSGVVTMAHSGYYASPSECAQKADEAMSKRLIRPFDVLLHIIDPKWWCPDDSDLTDEEKSQIGALNFDEHPLRLRRLLLDLWLRRTPANKRSVKNRPDGNIALTAMAAHSCPQFAAFAPAAVLAHQTMAGMGSMMTLNERQAESERVAYQKATTTVLRALSHLGVAHSATQYLGKIANCMLAFLDHYATTLAELHKAAQLCIISILRYGDDGLSMEKFSIRSALAKASAIEFIMHLIARRVNHATYRRIRQLLTDCPAEQLLTIIARLNSMLPNKKKSLSMPLMTLKPAGARNIGSDDPLPLGTISADSHCVVWYIGSFYGITNHDGDRLLTDPFPDLEKPHKSVLYDGTYSVKTSRIVTTTYGSNTRNSSIFDTRNDHPWTEQQALWARSSVSDVHLLKRLYCPDAHPLLQSMFATTPEDAEASMPWNRLSAFAHLRGRSAHQRVIATSLQQARIFAPVHHFTSRAELENFYSLERRARRQLEMSTARLTSLRVPRGTGRLVSTSSMVDSIVAHSARCDDLFDLSVARPAVGQYLLFSMQRGRRKIDASFKAVGAVFRKRKSAAEVDDQIDALLRAYRNESTKGAERDKIPSASELGEMVTRLVAVPDPGPSSDIRSEESMYSRVMSESAEDALELDARRSSRLALSRMEESDGY